MTYKQFLIPARIYSRENRDGNDGRMATGI